MGVANTKAMIVALVASVVQFLAKTSPFFAVFDSKLPLQLVKVPERLLARSGLTAKVQIGPFSC